MMSSASDRGMLSKATAAQPRVLPAGGEPDRGRHCSSPWEDCMPNLVLAGEKKQGQAEPLSI